MTEKTSQKNRIEIDNEYRTLLNEYRNQLTDNVNTSSDEYDKHVIQLSSATIGASFIIISTFPTKILSSQTFWLYGSWICCVVAILSVIISFRLSAKESSEELKELDRCIERGYFEETKNENNDNEEISYTGWANNISGTSFVFGVFFLMLFAFEVITFKEEDKVNDKYTTATTTNSDGHKRKANSSKTTQTITTSKEQTAVKDNER